MISSSTETEIHMCTCVANHHGFIINVAASRGLTAGLPSGWSCHCYPDA